MGKYNLNVSSRVDLKVGKSLGDAAYKLGNFIAEDGFTLLSLASLSLNYKVAQGVKKAGGLSIGFSPAANLRKHIIQYQLPTDVYDWLYFSNLFPSTLRSDLVYRSQALVLVGATMDNMAELALSLEINLPVAILIDKDCEENNSLLQYLRSLPLIKQKSVILHQDPRVLITSLAKMVEKNNWDLTEDFLDRNNKMFNDVIEGNLQIKPSYESSPDSLKIDIQKSSDKS